MKTKNINSPNDLLTYIEGIINDFESGITDKDKTIDLIGDLIIKIGKASKKNKKLNEI